MKKIKNKIIIESIVLVLSIIGLVVSVICDNSFAIGFCSSFVATMTMGLIKLNKISKSEEKVKEYEIEEKDERTRLLNMEARSIAFTVVGLLLLVVGFIGYIINNETILFLSTSTIFVEVITYSIAYIVLNKIK